MADDDTQDTASENDAEQPKAETSTIPPEVEKALRKANKEAETLRLKLKAFEDRDKSELEKALERAEAAERKALDAERGRTKADIARELGVPPRFVVGESEDEMREAAKEYLADREQALAGKARRAEVDQGVRGDAPKPDMNTLIRAASGRS